MYCKTTLYCCKACGRTLCDESIVTRRKEAEPSRITTCKSSLTDSIASLLCRVMGHFQGADP